MCPLEEAPHQLCPGAPGPLGGPSLAAAQEAYIVPLAAPCHFREGHLQPPRLGGPW